MPDRPTDPRYDDRLRTTPEMPRGVSPAMDVYESDSAIVVVADMPGVRGDGLDVVADRERLTIRGRVTTPARPPEYQEYALADYFQAIALTDDLDPNGIAASLKDGVLRVTIPKSPSRRPKKITIQTD